MKLAGSAGFCYGVKRALDTVIEAARTGGRPMFTLGPLIHNPQVISRLEEQGIQSVRDISQIPAGSILVLPTHGASIAVMEQAAESGLEIVDVTCPFVSNVHRLAENLVREGYQVIILGDKGHTEVRSILSRAGDDAIVISEEDGLTNRDLKRRVGILAQTTQSVERYRALVAEASERAYEIRAYNTICNATMERQKAAVDVAREADVMIVVGGRNSANTRRLVEICTETGVQTYLTETADEIDPSWFENADQVGVTAGASTPDWIIEEVVERIEGMSH